MLTTQEPHLQPDISRRAHWLNHLERHASALPDRAALRFGEVTVTWSRLRDRVHALADALARRGVRYGDRVALVMGNRPEFIEVLLAANVLGAIAVPLNFRLTGPEAAYILDDAGVRLIIVDEIGAPVIAAARSELICDLRTVTTAAGDPSHELYDDLLAEHGPRHEPVDVPEASPALIMYTSGTTGRPKGVVLTHLNLQAQALTIVRAFCLGGEEEVNLVASPLFHIGALGSVIPTILVGGTVVVMPTGSFDAAELLILLEREGVTTLFLVPTQWQIVCDDPSIGERDLSRLRVTSWGAAPATATLLRTMAVAFPDAVNIALFGQTEMTGVTCVLAGEDAVRKLGSVGKPVQSVSVRVVDGDMNDVGPGEAGEIVYRGPGLMLGYWNKPDATRDSFGGGWFHSGDIVRVDGEGYYYVVDRAKDMIISGGENIYCAEVENALAEHPNIAEVSLIGRAHRVWGETPVAFVVLRDPKNELDIDSLRSWASSSIARYKLPTQLELVAALPKNASGKVLKGVLREGSAMPYPPRRLQV
ncbi:AMP-binding protein [Rhodococcus opacus]|uniref:AMP-binding protein n=1 Tax=Rhodococcus opacus TaxID=37919 RepID=UPI002954AC61|nr:AMP-binding protein [Rhodococcus opacus]MDV7089122.1 AMP-binding protein [Rhodococcus opacus]